MPHAIIPKRPDLAARHNLTSYDAACATFSWDDARAELTGIDGGLNIAHEAVDRHVASGAGDRIALRCIHRDGRMTSLSYGQLAAQSNRFANVLSSLGIGRGDRVFTLLGSIPELYVAALGTLKNGSVLCPLFAAFGPEPIAARLKLGDARALVTTGRLYQRKVAAIRERVPSLAHVLCVAEAGESGAPAGTISLADRLARAPEQYRTVATRPDEMALLHFTSGTTGTPKGAVHVHEAVVAHHVTGKLVLDLRPGDVFWCTADPGWVTGTSYGIIAPLTNGATVIAYDGPFDAERWYELLERERVDVWYTAPTAIRMCMRAGTGPVKRRDLRQLRLIASVGEPLNPEAVVWGREAFGIPIHDNWWQTETGGIMIANFAAMDVKPGSMGRPVPGVEAAVVERDSAGRLRLIDEPEHQGELALRSGWPSMFRAYLHEEERYAKCFADGWYLTGDLVRRDGDGYYWFVGRKDDIIKSAGHLIGPFEVESALMEHPEVAEAGVIGKPDPVAMEVVKAFVSLKPGVEPSEELRSELLGFARSRLGPAVAPREIAFDQNLPKTKSGKIMRRMLRARELGLPEGDTSTLEESRP